MKNDFGNLTGSAIREARRNYAELVSLRHGVATALKMGLGLLAASPSFANAAQTATMREVAAAHMEQISAAPQLRLEAQTAQQLAAAVRPGSAPRLAAVPAPEGPAPA